MKIFLDFDDVIFNTRKFKEDYFKLFKKHKVSRKIFDECYYDPLKRETIRLYDSSRHIKRVCKKVDIELDVFEKDIEVFLQGAEGYVFSDVYNFLEKFSKQELIVLSFSKTNFQKAKIYNSGVTHFFGKVMIVDRPKGEIVTEMMKKGKISKKEKIFFIDDRVEQIESMKKLCPKVLTVLCSRKEGRYHDRKKSCCDYRVRNLKELERIINGKKNIQ